MGMGGMGGLGSRRFQPRRQQMRTTRGMMAPGFGFGAAAGAPALGYTPGFGGEMMAPRQVSMQGVASDWYPDMDAIETDDALEILIEIPGIPRDAIKLNVQDGYLVIDGECCIFVETLRVWFYVMECVRTKRDGSRVGKVSQCATDGKRLWSIPSNAAPSNVRQNRRH